MGFIIFEKKNDRYEYKDSSDAKFSIFALFLLCEIRESGKSWKDWFLDTTQKSTIGNVTYIEKDDGQVILSDAYSEELGRDPYFRIPLDNLIEVIDGWEKAQSQNALEIIVKEENNKINIIWNM